MLFITDTLALSMCSEMARWPDEFRPFYQLPDAIALLLGSLPHPQVLEAVDGHAFE
jgi:hypothetical protein